MHFLPVETEVILHDAHFHLLCGVLGKDVATGLPSIPFSLSFLPLSISNLCTSSGSVFTSSE